MFSGIYSEKAWTDGSDQASRSGPGSDPANTQEYRETLTRLLREKEVRSVVDLGCGDWASSRLIDWGDVNYTGIDIVPSVVESLNAEFGGPRRRFLCADFSREDWPDAELVIIKDVLQHWPSDWIHRFGTRLHRHDWALITNDWKKLYKGGPRRLWRWHERYPANGEIQVGESRPLRLTEPPFSWDAQCLGRYEHQVGRTRFIKEMLLVSGGG